MPSHPGRKNKSASRVGHPAGAAASGRSTGCMFSHPCRTKRGMDGARSWCGYERSEYGLCVFPPMPHKTRHGWGTRHPADGKQARRFQYCFEAGVMPSHPRRKNKSASRMGHPSGAGTSGRSSGCMFSHPCRTKRGMDGAPTFLCAIREKTQGRSAMRTGPVGVWAVPGGLSRVSPVRPAGGCARRARRWQ
jgi:hypothetical protein